MADYRIYVEKHPRFGIEAETLREELNGNLSLSIGELRLINVYDLFGFSEELLEKSRYAVFGEIVTDCVNDECDLDGKNIWPWSICPGNSTSGRVRPWHACDSSSRRPR